MKLFILLFVVFFTHAFTSLQAQTIDLIGPNGSEKFGHSVTVLPNGNYVVTDPFYDYDTIVDVGAVYLYNGITHAMISMIRGSHYNDRIGLNIDVLSNGNYLIRNRYWDNGNIENAGAVTWCSGTTGVNGVVSSFNSLVGSHSNDEIGYIVSMFNNGNYLVISPGADNNGIANVGAVTWCNGNTGKTGVVNSNNSLMGAMDGDRVGAPTPLLSNQLITSVRILSNGNYVVNCYNCDNDSIKDAGASTWANGNTGITGIVNSSNSLVGTTENDHVGASITVLSNSNYVIGSPSLNNNRGAATWINGNTGLIGSINNSNSLLGTHVNDYVGVNIVALSNGNYVVNCYPCDNDSIVDAGASTWANGNTGISGTISSSNSLVGIVQNDKVGGGTGSGIVLLTNGNYLIQSSRWNNNVGAITWVNGNTGITGTISGNNSLIGSTPNDYIGGYPQSTIMPLNNGNYLVASNDWDNGLVVDAGAVTWGNGNTGVTGIVSSNNSLVGTFMNDRVGDSMTITNNNNYLVRSHYWNSGKGSITWGNGNTGISGIVSSSNSLVGTMVNQRAGQYIIKLNNGNYVIRSHFNVDAATWINSNTSISGEIDSTNSLMTGNTIYVTPLTNGHYVVCNSSWDNDTIIDVGAVTWCNGFTGRMGVVSANNSLVGTLAYDQVGLSSFGVLALSNGNYVVGSSFWNNAGVIKAGAVTFCNGSTGMIGTINSSNSIIGTSEMDMVGTSITKLNNGNYIVGSPDWDNGVVEDAGAVTWCNGVTGTNGIVSSSNSLVGSTLADKVGTTNKALTNGNYVILSPNWDNGTIPNVGAFTWANGTTGINGIINSSNSVIGTTADDKVGNYMETISNGSYVVLSTFWDNGDSINALAYTCGDGVNGITGTINACNSVMGQVSNNNNGMIWTYHYLYSYFIIRKLSEKIISIFIPTLSVMLLSQPINVSACVGCNASFSITATNATSYQWEENAGTGFLPISNGGIYSNAATPVLNLTGVTSNMNGYQYRCIVSDANCGNNVTSNNATLMSYSVGIMPEEEMIFTSYPNPTADILHVVMKNINMPNTTKLIMYDALGQVVFEKEITAVHGSISEEINMLPFATGIYCLSFGRHIQKIVKK